MARNEDDAKDLVQDAFAKTWKANPTFTNGWKCRAYMETVIRNSFLKQINKNEDTLSIEELSEEIDDQNTQLSPSVSLEQTKIDETIKQEIKEILTEQEQYIIESHHLKGKKYQNIADELNLPLATVEKKDQRALKKLKKTKKLKKIVRFL